MTGDGAIAVRTRKERVPAWFMAGVALAAVACLAAHGNGAVLRIDAALSGAFEKGRFTLTLREGALLGYDPFDLPNPPPFPDSAVSLYSFRSVSDGAWAAQPFPGMRYLGESIPLLIGQNVAIPLRAGCDDAGVLSLSWSIVNGAPLADYQVLLRDVEDNSVINLRQQAFHEMPVRPGETLFELLLNYSPAATPTSAPTATPTPVPTLTPTQTPAPTSTPSPTISPTPSLTPTPSRRGWWDLFEYTSIWRETDYTGPSDRNEDRRVDERDVFLLYDQWHSADGD